MIGMMKMASKKDLKTIMNADFKHRPTSKHTQEAIPYELDGVRLSDEERAAYKRRLIGGAALGSAGALTSAYLSDGADAGKRLAGNALVVALPAASVIGGRYMARNKIRKMRSKKQ